MSGVLTDTPVQTSSEAEKVIVGGCEREQDRGGRLIIPEPPEAPDVLIFVRDELLRLFRSVLRSVAEVSGAHDI